MSGIDPVTPDSIARAKADCERERAEIERETGIRVQGDGTTLCPVTWEVPRGPRGISRFRIANKRSTTNGAQ